MAEPILAVTGLRAGYGPVEVLRGIDIAVGKGEVVAVLGANGVGKTTLNHTLSGLVRARAGAVFFEGRRIDNRSPAAILSRGLVHVPEGRKIFPNMTVADNLTLGSYRRGTAHRARNLERAYTLFPRLRERRGQVAGTLSGGEQQMLAIGRGLMAEPKLLILDEPSLGLSPLLVEELFALITAIAGEGLPVMLVEQNVVQSLEIAARAYVIENGAVVMAGEAATLRADPSLEKAYLGL